MIPHKNYFLEQVSEPSKFPESFGFGPDAYIGRIDVFYQIHCLNRLRMHPKDNYDYYYADTETNNKYYQLHVSYPVYMLLQNLDNAFPDFSGNHKCLDFGAVLKWHDEHSVPIEEFGPIRRPVRFEPYVMTHEFKEIVDGIDEYSTGLSVLFIADI
ncbi:hypothetical protein BBP40_005184 [Aspergillus hancockii]|nr:hypothetical protein BBP40_005184 [Aspergillus hancockii]